MKPGPDGDAFHLDRIVETIELIRNSLDGVDRADPLDALETACRAELQRIDG
ncbi:MAG: hypothetical protein QOG84_2793 [Sphingomonadales bacterium]|jgi:hypothetical protein|nr:hypothetical protein [Sphingomonadales bacterium]